MHRKMNGRRTLLAFGAALPLLPAAPGAAQESAAPPPAGTWPNRPIRFVVPFAAGGNSDVTARLYAERMVARLGQPVVVENRSGATGAIGTEAVIRSKPDGYTLLIGSPGSIVNGPLLMAAPRYDPIVDLTPVALLGQVPMAITVNPALPVRSLGELVAFSKARPGGVTIGTSGVGGANHLSLELFKGLCHGNRAGAQRPRNSGRSHAAAAAACHCAVASARTARSVRREIRWRWTLNVL